MSLRLEESIFSCEFLKLEDEKNGRLKSIDTTKGKIEVDYAVFACGIDTDKSLSIDTSSTPTPGIILKSKPVENRFNKIIVGPGVHIHQQNDGAIILGEQDGPINHYDRLKERPDRFPNKEFEELHTERIINTAKNFTTGIEDIVIEKISIGWRPYQRSNSNNWETQENRWRLCIHDAQWNPFGSNCFKLACEEILETQSIF